jgi:hypothetical protein
MNQVERGPGSRRSLTGLEMDAQVGHVVGPAPPAARVPGDIITEAAMVHRGWRSSTKVGTAMLQPLVVGYERQGTVYKVERTLVDGLLSGGSNVQASGRTRLEDSVAHDTLVARGGYGRCVRGG